jgi:hypothetical protein
MYLFLTSIQHRHQLIISSAAIQNFYHLVLCVYASALSAAATWLCDSFLPFKLDLALITVLALTKGYSFGIRATKPSCAT